MIREAMKAEREGAPMPAPTSAATVIGLAVMDAIERGDSHAALMLHNVPSADRQRVLDALESLGWGRRNDPGNSDARSAEGPGGVKLTMWVPYDERPEPVPLDPDDIPF